uniref:RELT TNF receptor n=1 Tax=Naja naja TaxID=35670 RepID=A0A8C6XDB8_NAJNA
MLPSWVIKRLQENNQARVGLLSGFQQSPSLNNDSRAKLQKTSKDSLEATYWHCPKCGYGSGLGMACKPCLDGFFSSTSDLEFCLLHTSCEAKKRVHVHVGTMTADTLCINLDIGGKVGVNKGTLIAYLTVLPLCHAPLGHHKGCSGKRPARLTRNAEAHPRHSEKLAPNGTRDGKPDESATQYAVLAIVPVFCIMGLLGILFCNLLMKKGYHCMAQKETDEEATKSDRTDANEDTIGVLVRLITEKKENAAVLEEMLKEYHSKQLTQPIYKPVNKLHLLPQIPHICRHQHHLHTIQGLAMRSGPSCTRCSQKKWPEVLRATEAVSTSVLPGSYAPKPPRPGEITILSVGSPKAADDCQPTLVPSLPPMQSPHPSLPQPPRQPRFLPNLLTTVRLCCQLCQPPVGLSCPGWRLTPRERRNS